MQKESWRFIDGYPNYMVSDHGNVLVMYKYRDSRILKKGISHTGYFRVQIGSKENTKLVPIHRLVALAFIDNSRGLPCVNHKDCNKLNNNVENLEWVTYKENSVHASNNGRIKAKKGEEHYACKITDAQLHEIKTTERFYGIQNYFAKKYGLSKQYINCIRTGYGRVRK